MLEYLRNKKILVVSAHPDDEVLGMGATMHKLIHEYGCIANCVILGEGITSRADQRNPDAWKTELEKHKSNIEKARQIIGYQSTQVYDFPDNRFDSVNLLDLVKVLEKEKKEFLPEVIFTHHGGDLNVDHQKTFDAVLTASRPMESETVKTIVSFETPSSTEWSSSTTPKPFVPNLFMEISRHNLDAKISAMESYEIERRAYPHPRSPEALRILAQRWGIVIGRSYAEACMLIRHIS